MSHLLSSLKFTPITPVEAREVLNWRYPGLPTLYNPSLDELEDDIDVLLTPAYNYYAVRSAHGLLVGFCCYGSDAQVPGGDYSLRNAVDVGLGMNPDLVGRGHSHLFLAAILQWGRECFAPDFFRATVARTNVRSLGMFGRAGFLVTQVFRPRDKEMHEFLVMLRAEDQADDQAEDQPNAPPPTP